MTIPKTVRIGPHRWRVRRRALDDEQQKYGRTDEQQLAITIAPWVRGSQLADTLLHELLHAIWAHTALDFDDDDQERIVRSLSPWLLGALRDNPELVAFLLA